MVQWLKRRGPFGAAVLASLFTVLLVYSLPVLAAAGDNFVLGRTNSSSEQTRLTGNTGLPNLKIKNTGNDPALRLETASGVPPMSVSSSKRVPRLNADKVDGIHGRNIMKKSVYDADRDGAVDAVDDIGIRVEAVTSDNVADSGTILTRTITVPSTGRLLVDAGVWILNGGTAGVGECAVTIDGVGDDTQQNRAISLAVGAVGSCEVTSQRLVSAGSHTVNFDAFGPSGVNLDDAALNVLFVPQ